MPLLSWEITCVRKNRLLLIYLVSVTRLFLALLAFCRALILEGVNLLLSWTVSFSLPARSTKFWVSGAYQDRLADGLQCVEARDRAELDFEERMGTGALMVHECAGVLAVGLSGLDRVEHRLEAVGRGLDLASGEELVLAKWRLR